MKHHGAEDTPKEMPRVRIHARIVPNGAVRKRSFDENGCPSPDCDDKKLRATLLLMPELVEAGDAGGVPFDCWPREVHAQLKNGVRALISPVKFGESGGHLGDAPKLRLDFKVPGLARLKSKKDIDALCDIWAGSLWRELPEKMSTKPADWRKLAKRVKTSLSGGSVSSQAMVSANHTAPEAKLYGADGQLAPTSGSSNAEKTEIVGAVDIRHADIALTLEHQRADALAASIRVACAEGVRPDAKALPREDEKESEDFWKTPPLHIATKDNTSSDEDPEIINALIEAIAKTKPRGIKQKFDDYAKVLLAATDGKIADINMVKKLLLEEQLVIAELHRRRRSGERTALFNSLSLRSAREVASVSYCHAKHAVENQACNLPKEPDWRDGSIVPATAASGAVELDEVTAASRYANWPQYRKSEDEKSLPPENEPDERLEDALRCFFTMQSTPTLARAAFLAVDLELDLAHGDAAVNLGAVGTYAHIRADLDADVASKSPRPWTLLRVHEFEREGCYHFWPVSRDEADCRGVGNLPPAEGTVRHYGGLMVMGLGSAVDPAQNTPRFDITSLDVRTAVELEIQRRSIAQANLDAEQEIKARIGVKKEGAEKRAALVAGASLPPGVNLPCNSVDIEDEGDRQDVGLTLLDRGLCSQAIRKMAARDVKMAATPAVAVTETDGRKAIVLDAEDLTVGYRLFVGTPGKTCTKWHPMMSRAIKFGTTGPDWHYSDRIEPILQELVGKAGSGARVALESAVMNVPGRLLPKNQAPQKAAADETKTLAAEAVFEQAVSVWDGGPMGVECSPQEGSRKKIGDTMIFGRELSIPRGVRYAIPRLRYGRPYRFALAAVYSGGHSLDAADFPSDAMVKDTRADLYYPSERMTEVAQACVSEASECVPPTIQPYARALRQAKIGAPQVMLPEGHAKRVNGPMGPDQSGLMLVRSLDDDPENPTDQKFTSRGQPATARRVILIPSIPLARAVTHMGDPDGKAGSAEKPNLGVFDNLAATPTTTGGLTFVKQQKGGGFLALKSSYLKGLNGVQHFVKRQIEDNPSDVTLAEGEDLDGSVFAAGATPKSTYYPDPAAEMLAIRVRLQGTGKRWLTMNDDADANPVLPIDLIAGHSYPDRRRVLFSLKREAVRAQTPTSLSEILSFVKSRRFDPADQGDAGSGGRFLARGATLRLAPHEWADVEMWLVPSAKRLARDFAVIQTLGIQLAQKAGPTIAATIADVCKGAGICLPKGIVAEVAAKLNGVDGGRAFFGTGGVAAPPMKALLALAEAVRQCMIKHPIPEIAAVSRLQAVHAANRATLKPVVDGLSETSFDQPYYTPDAGDAEGDLEPLRALRPNENPISEPEEGDKSISHCAPTEMGDATAKVCEKLETPIKVVDQGSTALTMVGDVRLDLNQIDTIEVRASMAFPGSSTFDDRLRGRSLSLRRAGWWPLVDDPSGADPDETGKQFRDAQSLFGFRVLPDGTAAFDRAEVTLLRAEDLPRPGIASCERSVSLRRLFEEQDIGDVRITERHAFPDGKARRMKVWVNSLPRTAQFMRTADRQLRRGDPWVKAEGLHYETGDLIKGEDLRAEAQSRLSDPVDVVLPATIRPAKPDAFAPVPSFQHEKPQPASKDLDALVHRRRSVIRIHLGREWYSSGEDERLGIVLWPPKISPEDDWELSKNKVTLRREKKFGGDRQIDLNDLRKYRLTKRKLADILCRPLKGAGTGSFTPFEDDHLGPGGRFVSRRGADPVREGNPHRQILFAPGDFPDLDLEEGDVRRAELVDMVEMPLSDDESHESSGEDGEKKLTPMMVALLTYKPRFDPELELWYVDVTLEDSEAAETFVRFGLVRYQPHTVPELQCSRPVRQFVQPLPDRIADVTRIKLPDEGSGVQVRLCGPTFYRRRVSRALFGLMNPDFEKVEKSEDEKLKDKANDPFLQNGCLYDDTSDLLHGGDAAPRMKVTLFRRGRDADNRPYRETIPLPVESIGREHNLLSPADHDTGVISSNEGFLLKADNPVGAGSVTVKAAHTTDGEGIWILKIPDEVFGDYKGLEVQVEEVEAVEPANPPTNEELSRQPVPSRIDNGPKEEKPPEQGLPNAPVDGLHHTGARMRAIFDLTGWAEE